MSYILDALKRASEQRGESTPGFRRLVTATPAPGPSARAWPRHVVLALCVVAVGAIAFVILRPAPAPVVAVRPTAAAIARAPVESPVAPVVPARQPPVVAAPASPAGAPPPSPAAARPPAPAVASPPAPAASRPPAPVVARVTSDQPAPPPARSERARAPAVVAPPRAEPPLAPVTPRTAARPATGTPPPPSSAATAETRLKLEVLVYSDVAAERMVFINGRKYVQGDTVAERARLEEIRPDGVVLSEDGRRFTLRH